MTKQALEKLNEKQMNYCTTLSVLISESRKRGLQYPFEKSSGKLRGYLECLEDMGVIKNCEMRALYLWFFSDDRSKKEDVE